MDSDVDLDLNVVMARGDLRSLDLEAYKIKEDPIVVEVAKAVTLALLHKEIEARVVCYSSDDFARATFLLSGRVTGDHAGKWDARTSTVEFPNGSAVVAVARQPACKKREASKEKA
jgi:hypothetical protein